MWGKRMAQAKQQADGRMTIAEGAVRFLKWIISIVLVVVGIVLAILVGVLAVAGLSVLLLGLLLSSMCIKKRDYSRIGTLRTMRISDGKRLLLRPLVVRVTVGEGQRTIVIPAGFDTDYSSIPVALHWFVHWSKVDMAGVIHDWLYRVGGMDRKEADLIWRDVALTGDHRASKFQAQACYVVGLRIGARLSWCRYRRKYR